jgi:outer membrane protein assembly factor BamB
LSGLLLQTSFASVARHGDGVVIAGTAFSAYSGHQLFVMAIDANAEMVWTYDEPVETSECGDEVVTNPQDDIFVTAAPLAREEAPAPRLMKLDPAGSLLWERYLPDPIEEITSIAAAQDGGVYLLVTEYADDDPVAWHLLKVGADGAVPDIEAGTP